MAGTAVFGGTFDPVHLGHIKTINAVYNTLKPERILFIPAKIPPFKLDQKITPDFHRVNMLNLALKTYPEYSIVEFELNQNEISYTYHTLKYLKRYYSRIKLIIGYDNYLAFEKWFKFEEVLEMVDLIVMRRATDLTESKHKIPATFADTPLIDISSTDIRTRVSEGRSISEMVPCEVEEYIKKNGLYLNND
ncbi:MAG: nicotinate-nucleotide adenylyltransferase [Melioribacteraceae bacterium]|nr:MAG: nicotinate-nucleotide adenylyltransferase [Melioribacteraceae bacterium]